MVCSLEFQNGTSFKRIWYITEQVEISLTVAAAVVFLENSILIIAVQILSGADADSGIDAHFAVIPAPLKEDARTGLVATVVSADIGIPLGVGSV